MKVLFLCQPGDVDPSYDAFLEAVDPACTVEVFDHDRPLAAQFKGVDMVLDPSGEAATRAMIDAAAAEKVKLWQVITNGTDKVDVAYILENNLPLANSPGPLTAVPLAEHLLMLILSFNKNLHRNRAADWNRTMTDELEGKVLSMIGFGASARELARRAWPFGMRIMAIDIVDVPQAVQDELHVEFLGKPRDKDHVVAQADYLSLHLHLNAATRHTIDRRVLNLMKPSAVLLNAARGDLVDEEALIEALQNGRIKGAGLDVYAKEPVDPAHPLLKMDNVIATAHTSSYTPGTLRRRMQAAAQNVDRIARELPPINLITTVER